MKPHARIGLDFDDTLIPMRAAIVDFLNKNRGTSIPLESLTNFRIMSRWGLTDVDFVAMCNENEAIFHAHPPRPGVLETLAQWSTESTLYVITGRPAVWIPPAKSWLERHGIQVADIFSAATMGDKAQLALQHGITLFVEDNASAALSIAQKGIDVLLMDAPYNRYCCSHPHIRRMKDWFEIQSLTTDKIIHERKHNDAQA